MRDAHAQALEAGLAWRPIKGSERARPPYELRPGTGRRGPEELWTQFDNAVAQLNDAGAGDSLADIVAAYSAVSHAARALADALQAAGE
jgi:sugar (pentulose or hexulose) kinase